MLRLFSLPFFRDYLVSTQLLKVRISLTLLSTFKWVSSVKLSSLWQGQGAGHLLSALVWCLLEPSLLHNWLVSFYQTLFSCSKNSKTLIHWSILMISVSQFHVGYWRSNTTFLFYPGLGPTMQRIDSFFSLTIYLYKTTHQCEIDMEKCST